MIEKFSKNSKKGLTLPVAIVISIVLVIVASGLIFIALLSISNTSVTVNGRQAFMDVRTALEYAESYYRNKVKDYSTIGDGSGVEYISARETSVSPTDTTAVIEYVRSSSMPDLNEIQTYVEATYTSSADSPDNKARLKLTGYSHYADEFGNQGRSVSLSVTFMIGSSGAQRRVTVIDRQERIQYSNATDTIKLNLKMPIGLTNNPDPNKNWKLCYYVWTYKDTGDAYDDFGKNSYSYQKSADGKSFTRVNPDVNKLNTSEKSNNSYTNMDWNEDSGTSGRMVSQSNNWYSGDYKIVKERVNYFNVIFTSEGKVLKKDGDYNSQLNEIFHLWYLFPDDKNVYFEFLNNPKSGGPNGTYYTRYYRGTGWNGKDGLDDTMLVYLRNQKTTVHFRALKDNKGNYKNEITALNSNPPMISFIKNSSDNNYDALPSFLVSKNSETECSYAKQTWGIAMTYEGCGWWVANIETKKTFDIKIVYKGVEYSLNGIRPIANMVAPDSVPEAWLVLKERATSTVASQRYLEAHISEKTALSSLGESVGSYVTVHAKNYVPDKNTAPLLSYDVDKLTSTEGRQKLYDKLVEVRVLNSDDYKNYKAIFVDSGLLEKAKTAYEDATFVNTPLHLSGIRDAEITTVADGENKITKIIERADKVYQEYINALADGVDELVQAEVDTNTLNAFKQILSQAKTTYYDHNELYDNDKYVSFKSVYDNIVKQNINSSTPREDVLSAIQRLRDATSKLDENKLDRATLNSLIDESAKYIANSSQYDEEKVNALTELLNNGVKDAEGKTVLRSAKELAKNGTITTQAELDDMETRVSAALTAVRMSYKVDETVDTVRIVSLLTQAQNKVNTAETTNRDFTDASKQQLVDAIASAENIIRSVTSKDQQYLIDDESNKLQQAIYRFDVIKPGAKEDASSDVADTKTRIWFNIQDGYSVQVKKLNNKDEVIEDVTRYVDRTGNTSGTALGLSCITLTDATTKKIKLVVNKVNDDKTETELFSSGVFAITELKSTDYLDIDYTKEKVGAKKSTVLFIARKVDNKNIGTTISVKAGTTELKKATSSNYYIYRFPVNTNSITVSALGKDYSIGAVGAGEYVIWLNGDSAVKVGIDEIYPKPVQPESGGGSGVEPTFIPSYDDDYEIVPLSNVSESDADAVFNALKGQVPDDKMCIVFPTDDYSEWGYTDAYDGETKGQRLHIYMYGSSTDSQPEEAEYPGNEIKWYNSQYIYYITDKKWTKLIANYGLGRYYKGEYCNDDHFKVEGLTDLSIPVDANSNRYGFYLVQKVNDKAEMTQRKHNNYAKTLTQTQVELALNGRMQQGKVVVILQTEDSAAYKFGRPWVYIWKNGGGKLAGCPKQMNGYFADHPSYYSIQFSKDYDSVNIKAADHSNVIGDTTLPRKADGTLYDYYVIKNDSTIVQSYGDVANKRLTASDDYTQGDPVPDVGEEVQADFGGKNENDSTFILLYAADVLASTPYMRNLKKDTLNNWSGDWNSMWRYPPNQPEPEQKYDGYYYEICSNECTRLSLSESADGAGPILTDVDLPQNPYTHKLYKYYIVSLYKSNNTVKIRFDYYGNDKPKWEFGGDYSATEAIAQALSYTDIKMAYVGGGKIRVKNSSYYFDYDGSKKNANSGDYERNIDSGNLFGGARINNDSGDRLGNSMLLPYYDWYEYKIPVNAAETYKFYVKGLDPNHLNAETRTVENVSGDVWVSLFNNDTVLEQKKRADNVTENVTVFTKAELSTFDIDVYQAPDDVTLYFKLPNGWSEMEDSAITKVHGIAYDNQSASSDVAKKFAGNYLKRQPTIYKITGISKHTPFIHVEYKKTDGTDTRTYDIKLQGGTKVLFNPNANGGLGGWEDFTSDQDDLKEVCQNLLDMYATKTIVSAYDSNGEVQSGATYHESGYVEKLLESNSTCFTKPAGSSTYQLNVSGINGIVNESDAYNKANELRREYDNLNTLYVLMSQARMYIEKPTRNDGSVSDYHTGMTEDSRYPEYIAAGKNRTYENIDILRNELEDAETIYLSKPTALDTSKVEDAINELNRAIVNLKVSTAGFIAVVLYDAQDRVDSGHRLQLMYYTESSKLATSKKTVDISLDDDINSEGYPILFVDNPPDTTSGTPGKIYDVQFYDDTDKITIGVPKAEMEADEAWVYMDFTVGGEWRENAITDFRDITADTYKQSNSSDVLEFKMNEVKKGTKTVYEDMTLYFKYDTKLIRSDDTSYTIKSGAYTFKASVNSLTGAVTAAAPLKVVDDATNSSIKHVVLDLFSSDAETYFTTAKNYKDYTENAKDGRTLFWYSDSDSSFSKVQRYNLGFNVNLDVTAGSFAELPFTQHYSYSTDKGINFRWSSPEPLYVGGSGVTLYASEYRLGAVGEINATEYGVNGTHFYLYSYDNSVDEISISILNDIKISYIDSMNKTHSFVIREGDYIIEKEYVKDAFGKNTKEKTEYIADLFNETYWKSLEHVKPLDGGTDTRTWGNGNSGLSNPEYGN